jgi:hypothetical protein
MLTQLWRCLAIVLKASLNQAPLPTRILYTSWSFVSQRVVKGNVIPLWMALQGSHHHYFLTCASTRTNALVGFKSLANPSLSFAPPFHGTCSNTKHQFVRSCQSPQLPLATFGGLLAASLWTRCQSYPTSEKRSAATQYGASCQMTWSCPVMRLWVRHSIALTEWIPRERMGLPGEQRERPYLTCMSSTRASGQSRTSRPWPTTFSGACYQTYAWRI